jgi:hypothetical protein
VDRKAGVYVAVADRGRRDGCHRARRWGRGSFAFGLGVWLGLGLAACGDGATVVTPIIDVPIDDADATASPLDEIELAVAHAGSERNIAALTFARDKALEVPGVPFGDDLVVHMTGLVGALPVAYGRTCAITVSPNTTPPTPHLFFSRSVKFASFDLAPTPRIGGLGIPYLGTALFVGGTDGSTDGTGQITSVERFEPLTGQLTTLPGTVMPREGAVQALIETSPPRVVVIGGASTGSEELFIEVIDDRRINRFSFTQMARVGLTATSLTDGRVIVIGGNPPGGSPSGEIDKIELIDETPDVTKLQTATLTHPRSGHSATRLGDDVGAPILIAGGVDGTGALVDVAELFKPLGEVLADPATFEPPMKFPRRGHVAARMPGGSVLIIGGLDALGQPVRTLELFSIDAGIEAFKNVGELPMDAGTVEFAATTLPDGRILLTGGRAAPGSPPLNTAYIARLDSRSGSVDVILTDRMAIARAGHQAVALCDGTILINGGTPGQFPAERYNPPADGRR